MSINKIWKFKKYVLLLYVFINNSYGKNGTLYQLH